MRRVFFGGTGVDISDLRIFVGTNLNIFMVTAVLI